MSLDGKLIPHHVGGKQQSKQLYNEYRWGKNREHATYFLTVLPSCKKSRVLPDIGKIGGTNI